MNDAVVMQIRDPGKSGTNKVRRIGFIIGALTTYPVKEFSTKGQVCNKIEVVDRFEIVHEGKNVLVADRHPFEHRNLISNLTTN